MDLKVENLSFSYDNVVVLNKVTFEAKQGRITGIIGPNGSGKTTLLRCIANFLKHDQGAVFFDDKDIRLLKNKEIAKFLSVVPQLTNLTTGFTVFETILMGRYPHLGLLQRESKEDYEIVNSTLERVGISHLAKRDVGELSGGEKQLVTIALALAQEPQILCLDEPTLHLDINMQYMIMDLCKETSRDKQIVVIVVLHDLALAAQYCDDLLILKNGKVKAMGSPDEVIVEKFILDTYGVEVIVGQDEISGMKYILPNIGSKTTIT
ncbi:MAG: ABC transporter ATP-binding protein [Candidatus Heimdallarchaeota archaeon]|nr:MAG: ABC transporter ATP-binding protein [Candidatus Heimdallarchaeota archaeon]